jgi:hypothetical protein
MDAPLLKSGSYKLPSCHRYLRQRDLTHLQIQDSSPLFYALPANLHIKETLNLTGLSDLSRLSGLFGLFGFSRLFGLFR